MNEPSKGGFLGFRSALSGREQAVNTGKKGPSAFWRVLPTLWRVTQVTEATYRDPYDLP